MQMCAALTLREKVIIDTDIGDDIDDALALALAVNSPELEVIGVTTVFKNTYRKAQIARQLLNAAGRSDIPAVPGIGMPLINKAIEPFFKTIDVLEKPCQYSDEMEQEKLSYPGDAVDFIIEKITGSDQKITLITIGPLTNIALALAKNPAIINKIKRICIMGGAYFASIVEYNILCDPEAARIVFESGAEIVGVGLDVTMKCRLTPEDILAIQQKGSPLTDILYQYIRLWRGNTDNLPYLHDPLAVGTVIDPGFVKTVPKAVAVETKGEFTRGMTFNVTDSNWWNSHQPNPNAKVCVDVENERFREFFMARILS